MQYKTPLVIIKFLTLACIAFVFNSCNQGANNIKINPEADSKFDQSQLLVSDLLVSLPILDDIDQVTIQIPSEFTDAENNIESVKVFESVRYVPLETTEESQLYSIENSLVYKDKIYILDNLGKSIMIFGVDGRFIRKIGSKGNGKGKYINPTSIEIDEKNQYLYIFDDKQSKFLIVDLEGNFIEEKKVGFRLNDFKLLDNGNFIINTDVRTNFHFPKITGNKLIYTDDKFEVFAKGYEFDADDGGELAYSRKGLYNYAGDVLYNPTFSYQIFTLGTSGLAPKYFIDAGSAMYPKDFDHKLSLDEYFKQYDNLNSPYIYIDGPIVETDRYLITHLRYKMRNVYFFYSKQSGQVYTGLNFIYEPYKMAIHAPIMGVFNNDEFYGYLDPASFNIQANIILKHKVGEIDANLQDISEFDNPIFLFYTLKDF